MHEDYQLDPKIPMYNSMVISKRLAKERMVKKLFAIGYQLGYGEGRTEEEKQMGKSALVKKRLNEWLLSSHSRVHRLIDDMSHDDLCLVVTQFVEYQKHHFKSINKIQL